MNGAGRPPGEPDGDARPPSPPTSPLLARARAASPEWAWASPKISPPLLASSPSTVSAGTNLAESGLWPLPLLQLPEAASGQHSILPAAGLAQRRQSAPPAVTVASPVDPVVHPSWTAGDEAARQRRAFALECVEATLASYAKSWSIIEARLLELEQELDDFEHERTQHVVAPVEAFLASSPGSSDPGDSLRPSDDELRRRRRSLLGTSVFATERDFVGDARRRAARDRMRRQLLIAALRQSAQIILAVQAFEAQQPGELSPWGSHSDTSVRPHFRQGSAPPSGSG